MDDFARAFFGINDRDWGEVTYTFDDIVAALNKVQPYEWAAFLRKRLNETGDHAPLEVSPRARFTSWSIPDTPTDWFKSSEKARKTTDLAFSGGFVLGRDGDVTEVGWDTPAFDAGLTVEAKNPLP